MELIAQGAEAKIYKEGDTVIKERIRKLYRLPEIDSKLRKRRTRSEAKLISEASRLGVPVPRILEIDDKKMILKIEYIDGVIVRDWIEANRVEDIRNLMILIGKSLKKLHSGGIIHGDLTTSNLIHKSGEVYFIDFGLGKFTDRIEDKAVDIHLFKEGIKSKHYENWKTFWQEFKKGYNDKKVLHHLDLVEARARYKKIS